MATLAWIGLGSNLGDRAATLEAAVAALAGAPGVAVEVVSTSRATRPVGGPPGQGAFLNAAARLSTTLGPHQLLTVTQGIEDRLGRTRAVRWGERTLDIDLLIFGDEVLDTPDLKLPHPRLALRRFVLAPLAEIAPAVVDPVTRRTIAGLLANLDRKPRLLVLEGPPGPLKATLYRRLIEDLPAIPRGEADGPDGLWLLADSLDRVEKAGRIPGSTGPAIEPTLAVVLDPGPGWVRRPGVLAAPLLRPESSDPEAILAEILATCRSIEET